MGEPGADPIPGIVRVAPDAVQVAQRRSHKNRGRADAFPFALDGEKDFGTTVEAGEFEKGGRCQKGEYYR